MSPDRVDRWDLDDPLKPELWHQKDFLPCPLCGRRLGLGGMKSWLIRHLRMHFRTCRPKHRVLRLREYERLRKKAIADERAAVALERTGAGRTPTTSKPRRVDPGSSQALLTGGTA